MAGLNIHNEEIREGIVYFEIEGMLDTQQGSGTFVSDRQPDIGQVERERMLDQILTELLARASSYGFSLDEVLKGLQKRKEASP